MAQRIDWFAADRKFAENVVEYLRCFVWRTEINLKFKAEQEEIEKGILALDKLKGSILEEKIPTMKETFLARSAELEKQRAEQVKKEATYVMDKRDADLKKALRGADVVSARIAIDNWFKAYGIDLGMTAMIPDIVRASGDRADLKKYVATDGEQITGFNSANCLKMCFLKTYEAMVDAGTVKKAQIPPIIAEKYAPKQKKSKKANKGEKKA